MTQRRRLFVLLVTMVFTLPLDALQNFYGLAQVVYDVETLESTSTPSGSPNATVKPDSNHSATNSPTSSPNITVPPNTTSAPNVTSSPTKVPANVTTSPTTVAPNVTSAPTTIAPKPTHAPTTTPKSPAPSQPPTSSPSAAPSSNKHSLSFLKIVTKTIAWLIIITLSVLGFGACMSNRYRIYFFLRGVWFTILRWECTLWILRKLRLLDYQSVDTGLNTIIFDNEMSEGLLMSDNTESG